MVRPRSSNAAEYSKDVTRLAWLRAAWQASIFGVVYGWRWRDAAWCIPKVMKVSGGGGKMFCAPQLTGCIKHLSPARQKKRRRDFRSRSRAGGECAHSQGLG